MLKYCSSQEGSVAVSPGLKPGGLATPKLLREPILYEPVCMAINCPLHPKQPAEPPARRRSPTTRGARSAVERGAPSPRRSKLEAANERARKLQASGR